MIGFITQSALVFGALFFFPVLGDFSEQARLAGASVAAVIIVSLGNFIWDLVRAPVLIDKYQREDIGRALKIAQEVEDVERKIKAIAALYDEGRQILSARHTMKALQLAFDGWSICCEKEIEGNFEFSKLHAFRNSSSRRTTYTINGVEQRRPHEELVEQFEGKLASLDSLISYGGVSSIMAPMRLRWFIEATQHPIYKHLGPIVTPTP